MPNKPSNGKCYKCPVCGNDQLDEPPYDEHGCALFGICPCCGVEFGYDDSTASHARLREKWLKAGAAWWSKTTPAPQAWNAAAQLKKAGLANP